MARRAAIWVMAAGLALAGVMWAPPASAGYPGQNGRIFFDTNRFGLPSTQIYSVRPDGTGLRQLTHLRGGRFAQEPNVSADGRSVVFVVGRGEENWQLWMMDNDGRQAHPLTRQPNWSHDTPAFTPDGRIVFSRCGFFLYPYWTCRVESILPDGSDRREIVGGSWHPSEVTISPDGSTVAYMSDKGGYDARLWLVDSDGSNPRMIVPGFKGVERPTFSPDGSTIAFGGLKKSIRLYTVAPDGSNLQVIATRATFPSWSPDGQSITFFSERARQMVVAHADGSGAQPLMTLPKDPGSGDSDWGVHP